MCENEKFQHCDVIKFLTKLGKNDKEFYADLRKYLVSVSRPLAVPILHKHLGLSEVCARWIPKLLTPEHEVR
uniref:Uncharacterized protein n=1 Tax=Romanomermis culicivorax TaxID=13658 RepID=A0A915K0B3_ROMCU